MRERCLTCGHAVTVAHVGAEWAAWCECSLVSNADPSWRDAGRGKTAEEALERWREGGDQRRSR